MLGLEAGNVATRAGHARACVRHVIARGTHEGRVGLCSATRGGGDSGSGSAGGLSCIGALRYASSSACFSGAASRLSGGAVWASFSMFASAILLPLVGGGGEGEGGGGDGGGDGGARHNRAPLYGHELHAGAGSRMVETEPETPVGVVGQEQTVAPLDST